MQTIRRLYLYAVAFVSLETVLWGMIGLARLLFAGREIGAGAGRLATALSLILVGVPVFLLHWWLAQRSAARDVDERSSFVRAVFLYGGLLALLVPSIQNVLAAISRSLVLAFGQRTGMALVGGEQSFSDNLVAIAMNVLIAVYLYHILGQDRRASLQGDGLSSMGRVYRYAWMLYGLGMIVFGVQQVLDYVLGFWVPSGAGLRALLANGIALLVTGTPVWIYAGQRIERSLADPEEAGATLRQVVLFGLSFAGAGTVLSTAGIIIYQLLRLLLGSGRSAADLVWEIRIPLSLLVPFGTLWAYYGRALMALMRPEYGQRANARRRLYHYVLSLGGLVTSVVGMQQISFYLVDTALVKTVTGGGLRISLASALASLLVGLPLWLLSWRPMLLEAAQEGEAGDHARRSPLRKAYLYLVLFAGVVGVMFSAGALFYQLISSLLGETPANMLSTSLQLLALLLLFAVVLAYHGQALRADTRMAARSLARRHAQYPVLILSPDEGDFTSMLVELLKREVSDLPLATHAYSLGAPDETLSAAQAVILPGELLAHPSEAMRLWLQGFTGQRLVVPTPAAGWHWVSGTGRKLPALAKQVARDIRHLAEGIEPAPPQETSPWMIVLYFVGALFGLMVLINLISVLANM